MRRTDFSFCVRKNGKITGNDHYREEFAAAEDVVAQLHPVTGPDRHEKTGRDALVIDPGAERALEVLDGDLAAPVQLKLDMLDRDAAGLDSHAAKFAAADRDAVRIGLELPRIESLSTQIDDAKIHDVFLDRGLVSSARPFRRAFLPPPSIPHRPLPGYPVFMKRITPAQGAGVMIDST